MYRKANGKKQSPIPPDTAINHSNLITTADLAPNRPYALRVSSKGQNSLERQKQHKAKACTLYIFESELMPETRNAYKSKIFTGRNGSMVYTEISKPSVPVTLTSSCTFDSFGSNQTGSDTRFLNIR